MRYTKAREEEEEEKEIKTGNAYPALRCGDT